MGRFDEGWDLLVATRSWLAERGYSLVDSRGPEGMDQGLDAYVGDRVEIRIVADRGQWFVEARPGRPAPAKWFNLESWSVCLGAPALFHDSRGPTSDQDWSAVVANSWQLPPQLEYLRTHLADIEQVCDATQISQTVECLRGAEEPGSKSWLAGGIDIIPDDPRQMKDLSEQWSAFLDFSHADRPDEPGAWNLVYSLRHIEESSRRLLDEQLPRLMYASEGAPFRDVMIELSVELGHLYIHLRLARYFELPSHWDPAPDSDDD